jgi:hypothetical protein
MTVASLSQHLYEFAVELRRLAYTMPGGHEDPLIQLSERMVRCARARADDASYLAALAGTRSACMAAATGPAVCVKVPA